jgi:hypothetical protein
MTARKLALGSGRLSLVGLVDLEPIIQATELAARAVLAARFDEEAT